MSLVQLEEIRRSFLRRLFDLLLFQNEVIAFHQAVVEDIFLLFVTRLQSVLLLFDFHFLGLHLIVFLLQLLDFLDMAGYLKTLLLR